MADETVSSDAASRDDGDAHLDPSPMRAALRKRDDQLTPYDLVRRDLAAATRRITNELVRTTADHAAIAEAADLVERAAALLAAGPHGRPYEGPAEGSITGDRSGFIDHSPFIGPMNPLSPPIEMVFHEDHVVATVAYGQAYEGPPGHLHGGFIAAGFDEVLGFTQSLTGKPGMTGKLEITYRAPTPLHREVRYVGRVTGVDGRKISTYATLSAGETLCAEAHGLFISMKPDVFERFLRSRPSS